MNWELTVYIGSLLGFGIAAILAGCWLFSISSGNLAEREKLPRKLLPGILFAVPCLIWCIPNARPILPDAMQDWCWPLVIICSILAFFFLDYLFSRALGGFLILISYYFLQESFARHTPAAMLLAVCCYLAGTVGIFFAGKPHLMRDLIRKCVKDRRWKLSGSIFCWSFGTLTLLLGTIHWINR